MYKTAISSLKYNHDYKLNELFEYGAETPLLVIDNKTFSAYHSLICVSKNGYIKKSRLSEYEIHIKKGTPVMKLEDNDNLLTVLLSVDNDDKILIVSNNNYYNYYPLSEINYTGRITKGVKAIKLNKEEYIKSASICNDGGYIITTRAIKGEKYDS